MTSNRLDKRELILAKGSEVMTRRGYHGTGVLEIVQAARIPKGSFYHYFDSKEALIAGLCERDRGQLSERMEKLAGAPDFLAALAAIGETYFIDDPVSRQRVVVEMGIEATRNARVAEIFHGTERFCSNSFEAMFQRLKDEGRIDPAIDVATLTKVFQVIGDGLFWRRAVMPNFDVREILPVLTQMIDALVRPVEAEGQEPQRSAT